MESKHSGWRCIHWLYRHRYHIFFSSLFLLYLLSSFHSPAYALSYYWGRHPQNERLVFEFQSTIPEFKLNRTERRQLTLTLPKNIWKQESRPQPISLSSSRLIDKVSIQENSLLISLRTDSFGYISFPYQEEDKIVVDIFHDPTGKKWHKEEKKAPVKEDLQEKKSPPEKSGQEDKPRPAPNNNATAEADKQENLPDAQQKPIARQEETIQTSKPYKIKSRISYVGPEQAKIIDGNKSRVLEKNASRTGKNKQDGNDTTENIYSVNQTTKHAEKKQAGTNNTKPVKQKSNATQNATNASTDGRNATKPDFKGALTTIRAAVANGEYQEARESLQGIKDDPRLPKELEEEVLYIFADVTFQLYKNDIQNHMQKILKAYERAMNYNPDSPRTPQALLNMGYINLEAGNAPEARGYFNLLRDQYPNDPNIPLTYYYWGKHLLENKQYKKAADQFEQIIENHPDNRIAKNAAFGLAKSLRELEYYKQARKIITYLEQRWPRYYLDNPDILPLSGFVAYKNKEYDAALNSYWTYINLIPEAENVDTAQARIGDIYLQQGNRDAAREVYEQTVNEFPEKEGGLIASMRLAEEGIHDKPSIEGMFSVFDRPFNLRPEKIYSKIINKYPNSPLAPVAQLKLAMWELFNSKPTTSLKEVQNFIEKFPDSALFGRAVDVGIKAFSELVAKYSKNNSFEHILEAWNKYPFLQSNRDQLPSETLLGLATALWKNNKPEQAAEIVKPIIAESDENIAEEDLNALGLLLNIQLDRENWLAIAQLAEQVDKWELDKNEKQQLDYAHALALENLGEEEKALKIWRDLASDIELSGQQRAYALYFMAEHAMQKKDFENVYIFAQEALSLFLQKDENRSKIKACLDLLIQTTASTGRLKEALGWGLEYETYVDKQDDDWASFQYTLAGLYKKNGNLEKWRSTLENLIRTSPNDIYAEMARSELDSLSLEQEAGQYLPGS
ncbi:MAG: tetratricopeptide repeat protein [Thermodesulfobacteriota bacterium]